MKGGVDTALFSISPDGGDANMDLVKVLYLPVGGV